MSEPSYTIQTDEPLFASVLYNRPVSRHGAGRLLIVGGHSNQFSLPTAMYEVAQATGLGECQVALPDNLARLLGGAPGTFFLPTNPSGSISMQAMGKITELAESTDAVAIGASLSNNSDTAMLVEHLALKLPTALIFFADALTLLQTNISAVTDNSNALVIATMPEVFKICGLLGIPIQIRPHAGLTNKLEIIHNLRAAINCELAVYGTEIVVASNLDFTVTPINYRLSLQPALIYTVLATLWIQNPRDRRAGLTTAAYLLRKVASQLSNDHRLTTRQAAEAIGQALRTTDDE